MSNDNAPSIVFLTYSNRVGSTFLARLLSRYDKIGVSLEAFFPDGIVYPMDPIQSETDLDNYLDRLYREPHFKGWQLSRDALKESLINKGYPVTYPNILRSALGLFFPTVTTRPGY